MASRLLGGWDMVSLPMQSLVALDMGLDMV
jgi:hypothetical protein